MEELFRCVISSNDWLNVDDSVNHFYVFSPDFQKSSAVVVDAGSADFHLLLIIFDLKGLVK